jgi:hypothetical protein
MDPRNVFKVAVGILSNEKIAFGDARLRTPWRRKARNR